MNSRSPIYCSAPCLLQTDGNVNRCTAKHSSKTEQKLVAVFVVVRQCRRKCPNKQYSSYRLLGSDMQTKIRHRLNVAHFQRVFESQRAWLFRGHTERFMTTPLFSAAQIHVDTAYRGTKMRCSAEDPLYTDPPDWVWRYPKAFVALTWMACIASALQWTNVSQCVGNIHPKVNDFITYEKCQASKYWISNICRQT